jgi:MSHA pilin protein MshD
LIIFIVVLGVGLAGILATYNTVVQRSADPMLRKQALAIAESMLTEIEQQPFTWCDPQDVNAAAAKSHADCAVSSQIGPTPGETRGGADPFDNVIDYHGYSGPASDLLGSASPALAAYTVSVDITPAGGSGAFSSFPADAVLRIAVTVTGGSEPITLTGYRVRYAPNAGG